MTKTLLLLSLACALVAGCAAPAPANTAATAPAGAAPITTEDRAAIEANAELFAAAFKAGETDKLAALYTEDAILYGPDEPAATGREAIAKSFGAFPPLKEFSTETLEIEGYGDLAYVRGTGSITMAGPDGKDVVMTGKYIEIHRKQPDGTWLKARDVFNFDSPAR